MSRVRDRTRREFPIRRLAITPAPFAGEALASYVIRISEANGFPTPRWVTHPLIGRSEGGFSLAFTVERLATLVGRSPLDMKGFESQLTRKGKLGSAGLSFRDLNVAAEDCRMCPLCVEQHGYVAAYFNFSPVNACPTHGCRLLDRCSKCGKRPTWDRATLTECDCGTSFVTTFESKPALPHRVAISQLMAHSIDESVPLDAAASLRYPTVFMGSLSTTSLVSLLIQMGRLATLNKAEKAQTKLIDQARNLLADWPSHFIQHVHKALKSRRELVIDALFGKDAYSLASADWYARSTEGWWNPVIDVVYEAICSGPPCYVNPIRAQRLFGSRQAPWLARYRAARSIGVSPKKVLQAARRGEVKIVSTVHGQTRHLMDARSTTGQVGAQIRRRNVKPISKEIGVHTKLLFGLIREEAFGPDVRYYGRGLTSQAVEEIKKRLRNGAANQPPRKRPPPESMVFVRLGVLLGSAHYTQPGKIWLLRRLCRGEAVAWRAMSSFEDLEIIETPELFAARSKRLRLHARGSIDHATAGSVLSVGSIKVQQLVQAQRLQPGVSARKKRSVTIASLKRLARTYISIGEIAAQTGLKAQHLRKALPRRYPKSRTILLGGSCTFFLRSSIPPLSALADDLLKD